MAKGTVTVKLREALKWGLERAEQTGRTQQLELTPNLYIRLSTLGGRKFLLFQLEGEPGEAQGLEIARALGFGEVRLGWHQGESLRSLTVEEIGAGEFGA